MSVLLASPVFDRDTSTANYCGLEITTPPPPPKPMRDEGQPQHQELCAKLFSSSAWVLFRVAVGFHGIQPMTKVIMSRISPPLHFHHLLILEIGLEINCLNMSLLVVGLCIGLIMGL